MSSLLLMNGKNKPSLTNIFICNFVTKTLALSGCVILASDSLKAPNQVMTQICPKNLCWMQFFFNAAVPDLAGVSQSVLFT